jgi:hypothetical protein
MPLLSAVRSPGLAEVLDARLLDGGLIRRGGDGGEGFGAELFELLIHGEESGSVHLNGITEFDQIAE